MSIPVLTTTWLAADASCPDTDGIYNAGTDTLITQFPQILDFTTDTNTATFIDIDGDGCSRAGSGPDHPVGERGVHGHRGRNGQDGSGGHDRLERAAVRHHLQQRAAERDHRTRPPLGATCASPPAINFAGSATRCIQ